MTKKILSVLLSVLLVCSCMSCLLTGPASAAPAPAETLPENLVGSTAEQTVTTESENQFASWRVWNDSGRCSKLVKQAFYQLDVDVTVSDDANADAVLRFTIMSNDAAADFHDLCAVRYTTAAPGAVATAQNRITSGTNESGTGNSAKVLPGTTYRYTVVFSTVSEYITHLRMNVDGLTAGSVTFSNPNVFALTGTQYDDFTSNTSSGNGYAFRYLVEEDGKVFLRVYGYGSLDTAVGTNGTGVSLVGKRGGALYDMFVEDGKSYSLNADIRVPAGATYHSREQFSPKFNLFETRYSNYNDVYAPVIQATSSNDTGDYVTNFSGCENQQVGFGDTSNGYSYTWAGGPYGMKLRRVAPSGTFATLTYTDMASGASIGSQKGSSSDVGRDFSKLPEKLSNWTQTVYSFTAFGQTLEETLAAKKALSSSEYANLRYQKDDGGNWVYNSTRNAPYVLPSEKNSYVAFALSVYMFDVVDVDSVRFGENCTLSAASEGNGAAKVSAEKAIVGDTVTFTAHPYLDSRFLGWYNVADEKVSSDLVYEYTVAESLTLTAKFTDTNLLDGVSWSRSPAFTWGTFTDSALSHYGNPGFYVGMPQYQCVYTTVSGLTPNTGYTMSFSYQGDAAVGNVIVVTTKSGVDKDANWSGGSYVFGTDESGKKYTTCVTGQTIGKTNDGVTWNDAEVKFTTGTDTDYYIILKFDGNRAEVTNADKAFDIFSDFSLLAAKQPQVISRDFEDSDVSGISGSGGTIAVADAGAEDPAKLGQKYLTYTTSNFQGLIFEPFMYNGTDRYVISFDMKVLTYGTGTLANGIDIKLGQYAGEQTYSGATISSGNTGTTGNPMLVTRYYENGNLFDYPRYLTYPNSAIFYGRASHKDEGNNTVYDNEFPNSDGTFDQWQHFEIEIDNSRTDYVGNVQFGIRPNDAGWVIGIDNFKLEITPADTIQNADNGYSGTDVAAIRKANGNIKQGIRVKSTIQTRLLEDDMNGFRVTEYGTLAIKTSKLAGVDLVYPMISSDTYKAKVGVAYNEADGTNVVYDEDSVLGTVTYTGVLTGISPANYGTEYTVRGYMVLENTDGRRLVLYDTPRVVSVYHVVYQILSSATSTEDLETAYALIDQDDAAWTAWLNANGLTEPGSYSVGIKDTTVDAGYVTTEGRTHTAVPYNGNTFDGWYTAAGVLYSTENPITSAQMTEDLFAAFTNNNLLYDIAGGVEKLAAAPTMYRSNSESLPKTGNYFYTGATWSGISLTTAAHTGSKALNILSRNQNDARITVRGLEPYTQYGVSFWWKNQASGDMYYLTGMAAVPADVTNWEIAKSSNLGGVTEKVFTNENLDWNYTEFTFNTGANTDINLCYQYYADSTDSNLLLDELTLYKLPNQEEYVRYTVSASAVNGVAYQSEPSGLVKKDTTVSYVCSPNNANAKFLGWFDESDNLVSSDRTYSTAVTANCDLTAKFEEGTKPADTKSGADITTALQTDGYYDTLFERAIRNTGNQALIANVLRKAQSGKDITLVGFGGSITQMAAASSVADSYSSLVADWLREQFPGITVNYFNAGIGSTTSDLGLARMQAQVLDHDPDLVIVDFTTNDQDRQQYAYTYEAIIRKLIENNVATMAIMFGPVVSAEYNPSKQAYDKSISDPEIEDLDPDTVICKRAGNRTDLHLPSLLYYDVPVIDYYGAMWDYLDSNGDGVSNSDDFAQWTALWGDYIHPNNQGHKLAANAVNYYLGKVLNQLESIATEVPAVPTGYFFAGVASYVGSTMYDNRNIGTKLTNQRNVEIKAYGNPDANTISYWSTWKISEGGYIELTLDSCKSFTILRVAQPEGGNATITVNGKVFLNDSSYRPSGTLNWASETYYGDGVTPTTIRIECTSNFYQISCVLIAE